MLSRLGHIWFSSATARLARLSQPRGAEIRRRPCIVCAGDGCKVRHCKGEVLITLVSVLNIMPLAVIHAVAYVYNR
jgi:hypothetical protein